MKTRFTYIIIGAAALFVAGCEGGSVQFNKTPAEVGREVFKTSDGANNKVDVLFIDDNSGSMEVEQGKMGARLSSFVSGLGNSDWQIAVTTTDVSQGPYGLDGSILRLAGRMDKVLTKSTPNGNKVFQNTIKRPETEGCNDIGECPSGNEQPFYAAIRAMEKSNGPNAGFFRPDANLAVVILTDEDESGSTRPRDVVARFNEILGSTKKLSVYGIIIEPEDRVCLLEQLRQPGNSGNYGTLVADLVSLTGGITGSICDTDYAETLQDIGKEVNDLKDSIELRHVPIPESVRVKLTPDQAVTWVVSGNKIKFSKSLLPGTEIDVRYEYE